MQSIAIPSPIPEGLIAAIEAAGNAVSITPDGLLVDDAVAVQAIIDSYVGSSDELAYHQALKLAALDAQFASLVAAGRALTIGGTTKTYQIDDTSRANITGAGTLALASIAMSSAWNADFFWIAADNSHQPMDAATCLSFAQNVGAYWTTLLVTSRAFKDAIAAAATMTDVDSVDVTQGWASNP